MGGLGTVRSLGRVKVPVIGVGTDPNHPGFASRFCLAKQCPHPVTAADELVGFLLREGTRLTTPAVLLPASDEFALFVSRYRDDLRGCFRFALPAPEVAEAGTDKRRQYELAEQIGVPYSTTH